MRALPERPATKVFLTPWVLIPVWDELPGDDRTIVVGLGQERRQWVRVVAMGHVGPHFIFGPVIDRRFSRSTVHCADECPFTGTTIGVCRYMCQHLRWEYIDAKHG